MSEAGSLIDETALKSAAIVTVSDAETADVTAPTGLHEQSAFTQVGIMKFTGCAVAALLDNVMVRVCCLVGSYFKAIFW